ncbi:LacI family transcription regulator [Paenibacillus sp. 598K]|uniref:LacI family DNA-binding transcriptional regulator n=1 Tax=Paenibacillus sp. 598K TaxID=1117987 RepID=UPI000FF9455D|nr:LacI family DNA-binding transcriptional regulator [Paenibacillus sp. 598K]GBF75697.1 LacI family transcription regulator [Paenibacillus sp. 598K]
MEKKVTLHDISKKVGLSTAAVSKALRGLGGISAETRQAVIDAAKELRYRHFAEPTAAPAPQGGRVLFIVDSRVMTDPHTMASYFFIDKALQSSGCQAVMHAMSATGDALEPAIVKQKDAIGLFLFGRITANKVEQLAALGKPMIMLDHELPYSDIDSVMIDHYEGAFLAVKHFVQHGHIQIGYIGDSRLSSGFLSRYRGFRDALAYWGLELSPEHDYDLHFTDAFGDIHFNTLPEQLDYAKLPSAFFCANDPIAFVLNHALTARGIRTPQDVSIIGFDNLDSCQWQSPPISSIDYLREEIAHKAVDLLQWRIANPEAPRSKLLLKPRLVVRESVVLKQSTNR